MEVVLAVVIRGGVLDAVPVVELDGVLVELDTLAPLVLEELVALARVPEPAQPVAA